MNTLKKSVLMLLVTAAMLTGFSGLSYADTTIVTTGNGPYFHSGSNPITSTLYFIGDVVVLPFRLLGNLFS